MELGEASIPGLSDPRRIGRGALLASWSHAYEDLAPALLSALVIFCRRVMPADNVAPDAASFMEGAFRLIEREGKGTVSVQAWSEGSMGAGGLGREAADALAGRGVNVSGPAPDVLSVYRSEADGIFYGLSPARSNRSPFPAGAFRLASRDVPSRSARKLEEAFAVFGLPAGPGRALDIGAAPGGWTAELLARSFTVTAVDRAPIALPPSPRLTVILGDIRQVHPSGPFDLIVCDANGPYQAAVAGLTAVRGELADGGRAVFTLKFGTGHPLKAVKDASHFLSKAYRVMDGRQLFHNRREATLLLAANES